VLIRVRACAVCRTDLHASPILKRSTSAPRSTTVPTISWPGISGSFEPG
jgi:D-arabinose 1-dehydrogenase-like Zn-dependent alcohol dehydrogenase